MTVIILIARTINSLLVVLEVDHDQITSSGYQTNFHSSPHYNLPLRDSIEGFRIRIPTVIKVTICFRTFSEGCAYFLADLPTHRGQIHHLPIFF